MTQPPRQMHRIAIVGALGDIRSTVAQGYDLAYCRREVAKFKRQYDLAPGCSLRNVSASEIEQGHTDESAPQWAIYAA